MRHLSGPSHVFDDIRKEPRCRHRRRHCSNNSSRRHRSSRNNNKHRRKDRRVIRQMMITSLSHNNLRWIGLPYNDAAANLGIQVLNSWENLQQPRRRHPCQPHPKQIMPIQTSFPLPKASMIASCRAKLCTLTNFPKTVCTFSIRMSSNRRK